MNRLSILLPAVALAPGGADDLELRTQALLQRRCLACHGPRTRTAGLDLDPRRCSEGRRERSSTEAGIGQ